MTQMNNGSQGKPNIVFILMDNLGYGELGCYGGGILRGAPTPHIDKLATDGTRLLNFNVEALCTPSRSAIMTGRFPIRSGTHSIPIGSGLEGLTRWEVTIETPSLEVLRAIEEPVCHSLGYGDHQRVSAVHTDTDNLHIHVAINKIHLHRLTVHEPYRDYRTLAEIGAKLEDEYNFHGSSIQSTCLYRKSSAHDACVYVAPAVRRSLTGYDMNEDMNA